MIFVCVGSDRVCYGGDLQGIDAAAYRDWVLKQDNYELSRFIFTGRVEPNQLLVARMIPSAIQDLKATDHPTHEGSGYKVCSSTRPGAADWL